MRLVFNVHRAPPHSWYEKKLATPDFVSVVFKPKAVAPSPTRLLHRELTQGACTDVPDRSLARSIPVLGPFPPGRDGTSGGRARGAAAGWQPDLPFADRHDRRRLRASAEVTGVALALFNKGEVVYSKAFGLRNKEKQLPPDRELGARQRLLHQGGVHLSRNEARRCGHTGSRPARPVVPTPAAARLSKLQGSGWRPALQGDHASHAPEPHE